MTSVATLLVTAIICLTEEGKLPPPAGLQLTLAPGQVQPRVHLSMRFVDDIESVISIVRESAY